MHLLVAHVALTSLLTYCFYKGVKFQTGYKANIFFFCVPFRIKASAESGYFWEIV